MRINNKYHFGQTVYLITDLDQEPGIVTEIRVTPKELIYVVNFGRIRTEHYDLELSETKQIF